MRGSAGWYAGAAEGWTSTVAAAGVSDAAPDATTAYRPGSAEPGTVSVVVIVPFAVAAAVVPAAPSRVTFTCSPAANPLPVTDVVSPGAAVGATVIDGLGDADTVTLNVTSALDWVSHAVTCAVNVPGWA